jgi:hypothetical protein
MQVRSFTAFRMTSEGLRMTHELARMRREGLRMPAEGCHLDNRLGQALIILYAVLEKAKSGVRVDLLILGLTES